jgi:hypothetical protein
LHEFEIPRFSGIQLADHPCDPPLPGEAASAVEQAAAIVAARRAKFVTPQSGA